MKSSRYSTPPTPSTVDARVEVLATGSVVLRLEPTPPAAEFYGYDRHVRAMYYELAAVLELRTDEVRGTWAVSMDPLRPGITLEVESRRYSDPALTVMIEALESLGYGVGE